MVPEFSMFFSKKNKPAFFEGACKTSLQLGLGMHDHSICSSFSHNFYSFKENIQDEMGPQVHDSNGLFWEELLTNRTS